MTKHPLFTIIIPTHNRASLLSKAIDSVLTQTCADWELIIVDDGSEDNTQEVVNGYDDQRILYEYQIHSERSTARNRGIEEAKGTYICFLDDDDYFLVHHLATFKKAIQEKKQPVAIFRTGMLVDSNGKQNMSPFYHSGKNKNPILFFLENMVGMHTLCFHRDILDKHVFDTRWMHFQDTHLLIRCLLIFPFYQIKEYTCIYNLHEQMGSQQAFKKNDAVNRTKNNVAAIRDLFQQGGEKLSTYVPDKFEKRLVSEKYLHHAHGALGAGKRQLAWKIFFKSINEGHGLWFFKAKVKFIIKYIFCINH